MFRKNKIIGIDLGGSNMRVALIKDKQISVVNSEKIIDGNDEESVKKQMIELIKKTAIGSVAAIGIGVPSALDVERGIIYDCVNIPSWKEVHLKTLLQDTFNTPVFINNDANCFALGEKYFGKGQNVQSLIGLIMGTGLGAGVIVNNKLYSGVNCGAGEIGLIPYKNNNYEYYCCGGFFSGEYGVSAFETFQKASLNDTKSLERMKVFGEHVGEMIKLVIYTYDPEMIILGGSVSKAYKFFSESMWKNINTIYFQNSLKNLKIDCSTLENVAILGAASLYYDTL